MKHRLVLATALVAVVVVAIGAGIAHAASSTTPFAGKAQVMFAVVAADGSLVRGYGVASASLVTTVPGDYKVLFNRGVAKCAYTATLGETGSVGAPPAGEIGVAGLIAHKAGVYVRTYNNAGVVTAASFHLMVSCPPA